MERKTLYERLGGAEMIVLLKKNLLKKVT